MAKMIFTKVTKVHPYCRNERIYVCEFRDVPELRVPAKPDDISVHILLGLMEMHMLLSVGRAIYGQAPIEGLHYAVRSHTRMILPCSLGTFFNSTVWR